MNFSTISPGRVGATSRPDDDGCDPRLPRRGNPTRDPSRRRGRAGRTWAILVFGVVAFSAAGCSAVGDKIRDLREKAATRGTPHVRTFAVDRRTAYAAAVAALPKVNLQFERGGAAQGELEAISAQSAEGNGDRRSQFVLTLRLADATDGGTEV